MLFTSNPTVIPCQLTLLRDAGKSWDIRVGNALRGHVPCHGKVRKISQGVADRGQFPVKDGQHTWLRWMENKVVQADVAVANHTWCVLFVCRRVAFEPFSEALKLWNRRSCRGEGQ